MTYSADEVYGDEITSPIPEQPMRPSRRDDQPEPEPSEEEEEEGEPVEPDQPQPEDDPDYEGPPSGIRI